MNADIPPTVYTAGENTHKKIAVHTERACVHLRVPQAADITVYATGALVTDGDAALPSRYKWCATCAHDRLFGSRSAAYDVLTDASPEEIP